MERELLVAFFASAGTIVAAVSSLIVARKYKIIGGDRAQLQLNKIYKEINDAYEVKFAQLQEDYDKKVLHLTACEHRVNELEGETDRLHRQIRGVERELDDVYEQLERHTRGKVKRPVVRPDEYLNDPD